MSQTNQSAADWDERYRSTQSVWSLQPNQFVVEHFSTREFSKVVDLAGGEGRNALWFASRGSKVENVEFSKVALEKFLERAAGSGLSDLTTATLADATTVRFQLAPNLILICYLQIPWPELEQALDNALGQLGSGEIFGVWHAQRNLTEGFGGPQNPQLLPTAQQLSKWAEGKGLGAKVWEAERRVETPAGEFVAIDVLLHAKTVG